MKAACTSNIYEASVKITEKCTKRFDARSSINTGTVPVVVFFATLNDL